MPRNNGVATLPPVTWASPGTTIRAQQHNDPMRDIEAMLTNSLPRDGSAPMNGNLPMAGRRITNLGAATQPGDAARFDQLPATSGWLASVSALTMAADRIPYATGVSTAALAVFTAAGRAIAGAADAAAQRVALGLGTLATKNKAAVADIDATGAPGSNTFLRGDGSWSGALGYGQAWQVVTRTPDVNYQNTTNKPIMVAVNGTGGNTSFYVGSANPANLRIAYNLTSAIGPLEQYHISAIIPPGHWYRITGGYGDVAELR